MDQENRESKATGDLYQVPGYGPVHKTLRRWWVNCAVKPDEEIMAIDQLENAIEPLGDEAIHIRKLIGTLESCHHKLQRHVDIIIEAIGTGRSDKGQRSGQTEDRNARERDYESLIESLSAWCRGHPVAEGICVEGYTAAELLVPLGEPTALKIWQVEKIIEKTRRFLDREMRWAQAQDNVVDIDCAGTDARFREMTKQTILRDTKEGQPDQITLAEAIDFLAGCNWDFMETVRTLLAAIGGASEAARPLALHARNVNLNPVRDRMKTTCHTLRAFCGHQEAGALVDQSILRGLGDMSPVKHWLAASLDKTIRMQLGF